MILLLLLTSFPLLAQEPAAGGAGASGPPPSEVPGEPPPGVPLGPPVGIPSGPPVGVPSGPPSAGPGTPGPAAPGEGGSGGPGGGPPPVGGEVLVQVHDANHLLAEGPTLALRVDGGEPAPFAATDDGRYPDTRADDKVWTGRVDPWPEGAVAVLISEGELSWTMQIPQLPADRRIWIALRSKTRAQLGHSELSAKGASPSAEGPGAEAGQTPPVGLGDRAELERVALAAWGGAGVGAGFAAFAVLRSLLRPGRPPRRSAGPTPPRRFARADLAALLAGPLAGHRVYGIGAGPGLLEVTGVSGAGLPSEWVDAVLGAAAAGGPPVALVVMDRALVEREGADEPLEGLAAAAAGRFPVWAVQGPGAWAPWSSSAEPAPTSGASTPGGSAGS